MGASFTSSISQMNEQEWKCVDKDKTVSFSHFFMLVVTLTLSLFFPCRCVGLSLMEASDIALVGFTASLQKLPEVFFTQPQAKVCTSTLWVL